MKFKVMIFTFLFVFYCVQAALGDNSSTALNLPISGSPLTLNEVLAGVEERYAVAGFSARFVQKSTIKAMDITDTASGIITVKRPGMMRWEYEKPDQQIIITDSQTLWIYRLEDNQVMIGKSPSFLGDGKGASFLADMKLIRKKFRIVPEESDRFDYYVLKLTPRKKNIDISVIFLSISKKTFDVVVIATYNAYGDKTQIEFKDIQLKQNINDSVFKFVIPEGADIIQMDE